MGRLGFSRFEFEAADALNCFLRTGKATATHLQRLTAEEQRAFIARLDIPTQEYRLTFSRSSGPGGQHVNKTSSKATLAFNIRQSSILNPETKREMAASLSNQINAQGELIISRQDMREQPRNAKLAIEALKQLIAEHHVVERQKAIAAVREPDECRERRVAEKRRHSHNKRNRRPEVFE